MAPLARPTTKAPRRRQRNDARHAQGKDDHRKGCDRYEDDLRRAREADDAAECAGEGAQGRVGDKASQVVGERGAQVARGRRLGGGQVDRAAHAQAVEAGEHAGCEEHGKGNRLVDRGDGVEDVVAHKGVEACAHGDDDCHEEGETQDVEQAVAGRGRKPARVRAVDAVRRAREVSGVDHGFHGAFEAGGGGERAVVLDAGDVPFDRGGNDAFHLGQGVLDRPRAMVAVHAVYAQRRGCHDSPGPLGLSPHHRRAPYTHRGYTGLFIVSLRVRHRAR